MSPPSSRLYAALALLTFCIALNSRAQERSLLTQRPPDRTAVFLTAPNDGVADATAQIQAAIDQVQSTTRRGIVFLGPGSYRISKTIQVWSGIRIIGYGTHRPVLILAPHTFTTTSSHHPLLHYAGERPDAPATQSSSGNASTFYSGLLNVDLTLGPDNAGATGISFHVAQHGILSHVRIDATGAFAAIDGAGNTMTNLELIGGEYGINTYQTAASWPYLLMDSTVSGQRRASIRNSEATATLIRDEFINAPAVLSIDPAHPVQIYLRDSTFTRISGTALALPKAGEPSAVTVQNLRCELVPSLIEGVKAESSSYVLDRLTFGINLSADLLTGTQVEDDHSHPVAQLPASVPSDIPALPSDKTWRSLRDFGAKGDDLADDTTALRRAIASGHPIYLPQGRYRITQPITLGPATVLIGLNPITTQITLADNTPAFATRSEKPTALLLALPNSHPILSGIGLSTGGLNPAASALLWQAGSRSLVDDVRFLGGHGTALPNGHYRPNYNADRTADSDPKRPWDTQPASLLVIGGGGTFRNLWTPNTYAAAGFSARDTSVPAHLYLLSAEHHLRNEVTLDHVQNWQFFGLQTEAEKAEGSHGVPLAITRSTNLLFANSIFYRVSRTTNPLIAAVTLDASSRATFFNADNRSQSPFPFESTIVTPTSKVNAHFFNVWSNDASKPGR